jgi:Rieske 2Fe-2S family protein
MSDVAGFDRADYPLKEAAVATWDGFIFVNLSPQKTAADFRELFAPLIGRFDSWQVGSLRTARSIRYELACNWKLVFLNYSECYHCPLVHPQLEKLSPSDSGRNDLSEGPFLGGYSELRTSGTSLSMSGRSEREPIGEVAGALLDRTYYYTLFPSMLFSLHADYAMVHYCNPLAVDRTEVICAWLFAPHEMQRPDFDPTDVAEFWDLTNRQDWHLNELTQAGMGSRAYSPGPYSNAEGLLNAFDRYYLECMNGEHAT